MSLRSHMIYILYFVACAVVWLAYVVGKSEGRRAANRSAIDHGTWVELLKPTKASVYSGESPLIFSAGIQGVVSGVDRWGRVSIWIAEPWLGVTGARQIFEVAELAKLAVIPLSNVDSGERGQTLTALQEHEASVAQILAELL